MKHMADQPLVISNLRESYDQAHGIYDQAHGCGDRDSRRKPLKIQILIQHHCAAAQPLWLWFYGFMVLELEWRWSGPSARIGGLYVLHRKELAQTAEPV